MTTCILYILLICCSIDYNLEQAESDRLMPNLLKLRDDSAVDNENKEQRSNNRHPSLFGLYPLLDRGEAKETRSPAPPPSEHKGLRLHVKVSELRWCSVHIVCMIYLNDTAMDPPSPPPLFAFSFSTWLNGNSFTAIT